MKSAVIERFVRAGWMQRLLWLEASLCLIAGYMLVRFVPFSRWKRTLGRMHSPAANADFRALGRLDYGAVGKVSRAVETAARVVPWQSACLAQAVAAKWMLARRGYMVEVYFGSRRSQQVDKPPDLHAWAVVNAICVTGASEVTTFAPMVRYFADR